MDSSQILMEILNLRHPPVLAIIFLTAHLFEKSNVFLQCYERSFQLHYFETVFSEKKIDETLTLGLYHCNYGKSVD